MSNNGKEKIKTVYILATSIEGSLVPIAVYESYIRANEYGEQMALLYKKNNIPIENVIIKEVSYYEK